MRTSFGQQFFHLPSFVIAALVFAIAQPRIAFADPPRMLNYQGFLKDATDAPVNGPVTLTLRLYDVSSGGPALYTEVQPGISVGNGIFNVVIGAVTPLSLKFDKPYWLGITINADVELAPRQPLSASPYALTAMYTQYKNMLVVTTGGGQYNSITAALNAITDNSVSNPYLILVAPGTYVEQVTMKPYVDIQGSGETTTRITQGGFATTTTGAVVAASNSTLRSLTVDSNAASNAQPIAIAIQANQASPFRMERVTAVARGCSGSCYGVYANQAIIQLDQSAVSAGDVTSGHAIAVYAQTGSNATINNTALDVTGLLSARGMLNFDSTAKLLNSTLSSAAVGMANAIGISNDTATLTMRGSTISVTSDGGSTGISSGGTGSNMVTVTNSEIEAATNTIVGSPAYTIRVAHTKLAGGPVLPAGGTVTCAGVQDAAFAFFASSCP